MNKREWFALQADPATKKGMPILSFPCVQLMGINVGQLVVNSDYQGGGMAKIAEKFPSAASVSMMDLSVEAEVFGAEVVFGDDEVPSVTGALLVDEDDVDALEVPDLPESLAEADGSIGGRCVTYARAIALAKEKITDRPVFAGVIGPFSLAGRLMDMTEIMVNCYAEPEMVEAAVEKCAAFITKYIKLMRSAGADGIVMAEPAAGLISPAFNLQFSIPFIRRIIEEVKTDDFAFIYHNCGNVVEAQIEDILTLGADAYHFGNAIDLPKMSEKIPDDVVFMGNIDPVGIFCGNADAAYEATMDLLKKIGHRKNFIPSSGCDVPAHASLEATEAFYKAVEDYYRG